MQIVWFWANELTAGNARGLIFHSVETVALGQEKDWECAARCRIDEMRRRSSAASQHPGRLRTDPPDFELRRGYLFQFASPASSPLDLSPTPGRE